MEPLTLEGSGASTLLETITSLTKSAKKLITFCPLKSVNHKVNIKAHYMWLCNVITIV